MTDEDIDYIEQQMNEQRELRFMDMRHISFDIIEDFIIAARENKVIRRHFADACLDSEVLALARRDGRVEMRNEAMAACKREVEYFSKWTQRDATQHTRRQEAAAIHDILSRLPDVRQEAPK